jgi:hypothetical protein
MDIKLLQDTPPWDWPRDARKMFKKTLLDRRAKPSDRLIAAELAGNMVAINDELADALLSTASSPDEPAELRAATAISLGPALEQAYEEEFTDPDDVPISEDMFHRVRESLHKLYLDESNPKEVRRRALEGSVRAPEQWHEDAIRLAYSSRDREWMLTAVFAMGYVRGFDEQILESLKSGDAEIHLHAVNAAGTWEVEGAWPHVAALVKDSRTPKPLVFAAIEAVASIRPAEARDVLGHLTRSKDEEIAEVALEAIHMAEGMEDTEDDEDDEVGEWIN